MYRLENESWEVAPSLNYVRFATSCCVQGRFVYAIGGKVTAKDNRMIRDLNSIERLDVEKVDLLRPENAAWEVLKI